MPKQSRNAARTLLAAAPALAALAVLVIAAIVTDARAAVAPTLGAAVVSPASGSAAPTQSIQLGVFSLTNNSQTNAVAVNSVTLTFSNPGLFSSTTLAAIGGSPATAAPPAATNVYQFPIPPVIQPGTTLSFSLLVTLANTSSRNETSGVAYASIAPGPDLGGGAPALWLAFAAVGLAMLAVPARTRRRAWLMAALVMLLAAGAGGCGNTVSGGGSDQPTGSSAQMVTAVSAFGITKGSINGPPVTSITGLPLNLGSITRT